MQRLKLFVPVFVFVFLGAVLMYALITGKAANQVDSVLIGRDVPEFALLSLKHGEVSVSNESLVGEPYLLNVWATWCGPCKAEHPELVRLAKNGVKLVGVNYKDTQDLALKWLEEGGDPYVVTVRDDDGRLGLDLGSTGIPETFFVDGNGVIQYKHTGPISEKLWNTKLAAQWKSLHEDFGEPAK